MTDDSSKTVPATIGGQLKSAREAKGLTLEQVSRETQLSLRYLQALEADDFEALPGVAFVRGYIRRYAERVGLSAGELIARYDEVLPSSSRLGHQAPLAAPPLQLDDSEGGRSTRTTRILIVLATLFFLVYVAASVFWHSEDTEAVAPAAPVAVEAPVVDDIDEAMPAMIGPTQDPAEAAESPESVMVDAASGPVEAASTSAPVAVSEPAPVAPRIDTLSFNFTGTSWISVRDATGQELVYGLKNAGQSVTVSGQPPFTLNIGNVNVTTVDHNGRRVDLKPYARGDIASFRLGR